MICFLGKEWVAQTTINFADDEELLALAAKTGYHGVFIGFESPTFPVARYKNFTHERIIQEMMSCNPRFYSLTRILRRVWSSFWRRRHPLISLVGNLSYRNNSRVNGKTYADFQRRRHHFSRINRTANAKPMPEQI